ncbi:MAG: F-box protein, partial [Alphaproteobacteria bacterium]
SLTKFRLSKLAFIVFAIQNIAFAKGQELGAADDAANATSSNQSAHATASFDSLPPEIVEAIFQNFSQADLKKVRSVDKKFNTIANEYIQNIKVPSRFSAEMPQLLQTFVRNLRNVNLQFSRKPSCDVLELVRDARIKALQLNDLAINAQNIQELATPSFELSKPSAAQPEQQ